MSNAPVRDGITALPTEKDMAPEARKIRDYYACKPDRPLNQCEFAYGYYFTMDRWRDEGMPQDVPLEELFGFDPPPWVPLWRAGWGGLPLATPFEEQQLEDLGEKELVRNASGQHVLRLKCPDGASMPEFVDHPVKDLATWERDMRWRLEPDAPQQWEDWDEKLTAARADAAKGYVVVQHAVGGYMYLRSLIGPIELLYAFHDQPELVHACMQAWLNYVDAVTARHQSELSLDVFFLGEDICFNHGPLISPEMIREFLLPYYQQAFTNAKRRQCDPNRKLHFHIDTDGLADPAIPVYAEVDVDEFSPFEVASGCDVVRTGREHPGLLINGGIDKRVLASTPDAIDRHLEAILPAMRRRGGFYPTCDHGVPTDVSYGNYLHYRKRAIELGG